MSGPELNMSVSFGYSTTSHSTPLDVAREDLTLPIIASFLELPGVDFADRHAFLHLGLDNGRIHKEIRKFLMYSSKMIKSDDELMIEIGENGKL